MRIAITYASLRPTKRVCGPERVNDWWRSAQLQKSRSTAQYNNGTSPQPTGH